MADPPTREEPYGDSTSPPQLSQPSTLDDGVANAGISEEDFVAAEQIVPVPVTSPEPEDRATSTEKSDS